MKFIVDECTGPGVARWLIGQGHTVFSVYDQDRGLPDETILQKAFAEGWILITNDKDFGEKVYREKLPHHGVIFLRLADERSHNKITVLQQLLSNHEENLAERFVVVTEKNVRFAQS
jgi:predicted nuclease of predicted toxin-antitoxin system